MSRVSAGQCVMATATMTPVVPPPREKETRIRSTRWGMAMKRSHSHRTTRSNAPPIIADSEPSNIATQPEIAEAKTPMTMERDKPRMVRQNMSCPR